MDRAQRNQESENLMQRFLQGEQAAFYALAALWKQPLVNYFYAQLGNFQLAEDLSQEVLIRVYQARSYTSSGRFAAWLYRIAGNLLRDHLRRQRLKLLTGDPALALADVPAPLSDPSAALLVSEEQAQVYTTLHSLSAAERDLLILSQIQGLSYQELADLHQLPLSSIKGKIYRAVQKFIRSYRKEPSYEA